MVLVLRLLVVIRFWVLWVVWFLLLNFVACGLWLVLYGSGFVDFVLVGGWLSVCLKLLVLDLLFGLMVWAIGLT